MIVKIKNLINLLFILDFFKERFIFRINVSIWVSPLIPLP